VKLDPTNEELFTHLFMSYARIFDFKSQQKTAMTLYKHKPKTPYYCWAVMSIILQATRGEGKDDLKKRKLLLSLAERMMEKLIVDGKLDAEQEVQLYIMVLELQEKYEEIMVILEGPLGTKLACSNPPQNRLKYLLPLTRWDEINLLCKGILMESVDRWDIWKEYINSVFELMAAKPCVETNNHDNHDGAADGDMETVDDTPEKCHEFICRIVENGADNGIMLLKSSRHIL
jgi:N-terminal acetyltransferase B complex non-catalytic subunit